VGRSAFLTGVCADSQFRDTPREPLVAIVVLNWNRGEETLACLRSLDRLEYGRYSVVVVDNGSTDGSVARLQEARPDVELLESRRNRGYAGGNNIGIRHALTLDAEFVWILNNDTEVEPGALTALVEALPSSEWGILASSLIDPASGDIRATAGVCVNGSLEPMVCIGCDLSCHPASALMGASLFVRRDVFADVGFLDESYFHYFEERDFVERARRFGWRLGLACRSRVLHEEGATLAMRSPQATYYFVRNHLLFERRFSAKHPLRIVVRDSMVIRRHLALRHALRFRDFRGVIATTLGVSDAVFDRTGSRDLGPRFSRPLRWA
jgi:GT2 family glycosyltransferase